MKSSLEKYALDEYSIFQKVEKIPTIVFPQSESASKAVAHEIAGLIHVNEIKGLPTVLGLNAGSTPIGIYQELVRLYEKNEISFKEVYTFNLDEFYPISPYAVQSRRQYMEKHLFSNVDIPIDNIFFPSGDIDEEQVAEFCLSYEEKIEELGGIDILLLGVNGKGHIGLNEPGSFIDSKTRLISLDKTTRLHIASNFKDFNQVPRKAITMGVDTLLSAKRIFLMGFGEGKAPIIKQTVEQEWGEAFPSSLLQIHADATVVIDKAAAGELTRFKTPWLYEACSWSDSEVRKAVVWLCLTINKPILKLTDSDYMEHGMSDLLTHFGSAYDTNIKVFNELQHTITGWPGGKPGVDDSQRPERATPAQKKVLIFSPHPDDDVISMGGTLSRLVAQDHKVHVAYQTSGNIAVFDEDVQHLLDMVNACNTYFGVQTTRCDKAIGALEAEIQDCDMQSSDSDDMLFLKGMIRRTEAVAACRFFKVPKENLHFMELPFYKTGTIDKAPMGEADIEQTVELLREVRPDQIFAAGDLSDPHGTHRICLEILFKAIDIIANDDWFSECRVWLYRGAWQEWRIDEAHMAVPLSPGELKAKRMAILKHESQKDGVLFPGSDDREFWQRAEDRNRNTALLYDKLGFAEYEAMELFVRWR